MKIYKDVFTQDELFSDTYKMTLVKDCLYEVVGKYETRTDGEVVLEGSNASAEEADEGTDTNSTSGIDIVLNHRLVETGFSAKKDFGAYLKDYMKKVQKFLEENDRKGEIDAFKANVTAVVKELLPKFKELQFFSGEACDPDAMVVMCEYKEVDGEERPVLMFFKHGLEEEKC